MFQTLQYYLSFWQEKKRYSFQLHCILDWVKFDFFLKDCFFFFWLSVNCIESLELMTPQMPTPPPNSRIHDSPLSSFWTWLYVDPLSYWKKEDQGGGRPRFICRSFLQKQSNWSNIPSGRPKIPAWEKVLFIHFFIFWTRKELYK